jgi:DNA primase catalytic core
VPTAGRPWGAIVKQHVDLLNLVQRTVALKQQGKRWVGLCPLHSERTPSLSVDPEAGLWKCFGCNEGGDVISWQMAIGRQEFREACEELAQIYSFELDTQPRPSWWAMIPDATAAMVQLRQQMLQDNPKVLGLLAQRGVNQQLAKDWELGFSPSNHRPSDRDLGAGYTKVLRELGWITHSGRDQQAGRISFPVRDLQGKIVAQWGRLVGPTGEGSPKYMGTPSGMLLDKSRVLFGSWKAEEAIRDTKQVVLVEGSFDCLAVHCCGVANTLALLGTSLAEPQIRWIVARADQVILMLDSDRAGRAAAQRVAGQIEGRAQVLWAPVPGGKDPAELWAKGEGQQVLDCLAGAQEAMPLWVQQAIDAVREASDPQLAAEATEAAQKLVAGIEHPTLRHQWTRRLEMSMGPQPSAARRRAAPVAPTPAEGDADVDLDRLALWQLWKLRAEWEGFWPGLLRTRRAVQLAQELVQGADPDPWMGSPPAPGTSDPDWVLWSLVWRRTQPLWARQWAQGEPVQLSALRRIMSAGHQGARQAALDLRALLEGAPEPTPEEDASEEAAVKPPREVDPWDLSAPLDATSQ